MFRSDDVPTNRLTERMRKILPTLVPCSRIFFDEPMKNHTSFRIGGPADVLVIPSGEEDIIRIVTFSKDEGVPCFVMGRGTNLLVRDKGIRGIVIKTSGALDHIAVSQGGDCGEIRAGSGLDLAVMAARAADESLSGLEFACGIPGSVGGAVVMNAGAYDGEMSQIVKSVKTVTRDGKVETLLPDQLGFGYRYSSLQTDDRVVVEVTISLKPGERRHIIEKMEDLQKRRRLKQPLDLPSAGSVFRRPQGHFSGPLIEGAGLKGYRLGGAQVSQVHAGFIVNVGNATAEDVLRLIELIQDRVMKTYGVAIEPEIKIVGES